MKMETTAIFGLCSLCCILAMSVRSGLDYSRKGDIIVAALLPLSRGPLCQDQNPPGVLIAEAMTYAMSKTYSSYEKNYTLGYDIKDTCGDPRVAIQAAFDLVTVSRDGNSSRVQMRRRTVAVVIDGSNSTTQTYVKGILDMFGLPQVR